MKKKRKLTLSTKQLNNQLVTWRKEDRETYKQILMYAEQQGVLLKNNTISMSKKNLKKVQQFSEQYQHEFGSYSSYMTKKEKQYTNKVRKYAEQQYQLDYDKLSIAQKKEVRKELIKSGFIQPNVKKQISSDAEYSELIGKLFDSFPSQQANEEKHYTLELPQDIAIKRLREEIEEHKILPPVEEYINEYQDYEPPF